MKVITQRPSWKIATDPTSPLAGPRATPRPRTRPAIVGHVGSFPDLIPHIPADRTAHGGPGQDRRAAAKMPFRSAIRLAYSLHMRCRDLPWTDTSAVRSLAHTEQRNRCGLAALSTRDSPRSSCVARRGRAPARRTADRLRTSRPRCRTRGRPYPVTGFPEEVRGRRPSYRGPANRAHVCVEWISGSVLVSGIRIGSIARLSYFPVALDNGNGVAGNLSFRRLSGPGPRGGERKLQASNLGPCFQGYKF